MIIAVDTGGTKTLIEAFDHDGTKTFVTKFATPRAPEEYIKAVSEAVLAFTAAENIDCLSIAIPGPMRDGKLLWAINLGWSSLDIVELFRGSFPNTKIVFANDAMLGGLAEARAIETPPALSLYLTLSTGVGGGLAANGRLLPGLSIFEAGQIHTEHNGQLQRWEDFASGHNFYERYQQYGADVDDPAVWQDYAQRVATGLLVIIPMLSPDRVIIGGSMGTHYHKYGQFLEEILQRQLPIHMQHTQITQAKNPEEAVIYGCYYNAIDALAG